MPRKPKEIVAFGDFQTPEPLALQVTQRLASLGLAPRSVVEPTCGKGAFLEAAARTFPEARLVGADINPAYLAEARRCAGAELHCSDFFATDWNSILANLPEPWLILGNPPWVTVAGLKTVGSDNAPARSNVDKLRGIEALTGRGNFDISEWMIREYLRWLEGRIGAVAVLCKFTVARKVLAQAWKRGGRIARARFFRIDALRDFGAAVEAGLLVIETGVPAESTTCDIYDDLATEHARSRLGFQGAFLIADLAAFQKHPELLANDEQDLWRSGIKHDCAAVMELTVDGSGLRNGFGEHVEVEPAHVYPLLKGSDIANGRQSARAMIVPQTSVGEDTSHFTASAPATWRYLNGHADRFTARRSAIYKDRPPFAIFGVGPYTFAPWKVAISGLHKRLAFACVGPVDGRPVVFDDTVAFLPCASEAEARRICALLATPAATAFLESMIFWSDKRPITTGLLRRLNLRALADVAARDYPPALARTAASSSRSVRAPVFSR